MPWSNNTGGPNKSQGPWGGGGRGGNGGGGGPWGGGQRGGGGGGGGGGGQGPNIDDLFKKGQNRLKNVLGDGAPRSGGFGGALLLAALVAVGAWAYVSVFQVKPEEQAAILTFGNYTRTVGPGLNFAPWPVQTSEIRAVTKENIVEIGQRRSGATSPARGSGRTSGLMLTGDENIIDINFQVVWTIRELDKFLFNLADPDATINAVAESAMREVVGRSELAPLLNRDRALLEQQVYDLIQRTLDEYEAGVAIRRVNLDRADPPPEVIDAFRDVQAAEQERDTLLKQAQAYYNEKTAGARGESAQLLQQAEGYRAQVVAVAQGEAERFNAIYEEYFKAKDVTRKRLYLETMEKVFGGINKIIIDQEDGSANGVVPYLPLDQLNRTPRSQN
ncbi:MAG: FtsH protease activity modulator HflK [Rhodobacteraceae bacterium]|nr:FtsH protease activity modulator HflK [Paracoccaceae bacterium]